MKRAFDFLLSIFKKKIRITFFQDDFQPLFSLRFTIVTFLIWIIGYATIVIMITLFIISKTSLKEYIPGYGGIKEKKQILQLIKKTDSLENVIQIKGQYVQNILRILSGENSRDSLSYSRNTISEKKTGEHLKSGYLEKSVRDEIEREINSQPSVTFTDKNSMSDFQFMMPSKGVVISKFDPEKKHFGIDITGKLYEPVRSIDKGIVVYSDYSFKYGNCIIILHPNNYLSVYKHMSVLMKDIGSVVAANEMIGTMGNTGTESYGVHLHFELWNQKKPLDPISYILF